MGANSSDVADPATPTATARGFVDENASCVHDAFRNSRKVMEPVGRNAPTRLATMRSRVPTAPPGDMVAMIPGVRRLISMVNVWQAGAERSALPHTVVGPKIPAAAGAPVRKPV